MAFLFETKWKPLLLVLILCLILQVTSCAPDETHPATLRVYAAASLITVMPQLRDAFVKRHPQSKVELTFAASSVLAKQIARGAAADLFISANMQWVDYLEEKALVRPENRFEFIGNRLVLIVPKVSRLGLSGINDLSKPDVHRIALADWAHVPAGLYAKQALQKRGLWAQIAPKCIPALDVRAALTYVARGDVDCGIVYRTDARLSGKVTIVGELPDEIQPDIRYSIALLQGSSSPFSEDFLAFLRSKPASEILTRQGFLILKPWGD